MSLNTEATNVFFKGLKCAYTGAPVNVRVVAAGAGRPHYMADAFDPSIPRHDLSELLRALGMRDGVLGAVSEGNERVCAYTGRPLTLRKTEAGFSFSGGFRPSSPVADPADLARQLMMRDGKIPAGAPDAGQTAARVQTAPREPVETPPKDPGLSDEAMAAVEPIVAKATLRRARITVPSSPCKHYSRRG